MFAIAGMIVVYSVLAILVTIETRSFSTLFALAFFLSLMAFGFGIVINVAAIAMGDLYGYANFGIFFSFLQFAGVAAAVITPFVGISISAIAFSWGWVGILAISLLLLIVVPITKFNE